MESTKTAKLLTWLALIALVVFFLFKAIWMVWGDEDFFSSFFLWWVAGVLVLPSAVLPFLVGYWAAKALSKRFENMAVLGVTALLSIVISGSSILIAIQSTPGIGCRYMAISAEVFDR